MTDRKLLDLLDQFRQAADENDAKALAQIEAAYRKLYGRVSSELELELRRMWEEEGNTISQQRVVSRLAYLREQLQEELTKFGGFIENSIPGWSEASGALGMEQAYELLVFMAGDSTGLFNLRFNELPKDAIETILGFTQEGSPLYERISLLAPYHTERVIDTLVQNIALGFGPRRAAREIAPFLEGVMDTARNVMANPLADALRMARTAQLWSQRETSRAQYIANGNVVEGWIWFAYLDTVVCMSCVAEHGSIHSLDEVLDDHHNGRCAMLPYLGGDNPVTQGGEEWFGQLDEQRQREMMGPGLFEAWTNNQFEFGALSREVDDDVYGVMRTQTPLKDLIANE